MMSYLSETGKGVERSESSLLVKCKPHKPEKHDGLNLEKAECGGK